MLGPFDMLAKVKIVKNELAECRVKLKIAEGEATDYRAMLKPMLDLVTDIRTLVEGDIAEIEGDDRYHRPPAIVTVDPLLALFQMGMDSRIQLAKKVLDVIQAHDKE